ncbi:hypothetical protein Ae201684P_005188 [Aphanomyces euteiches]|nr:hypothetical protein Ae201684P_005188 [Aphanomyces euteiches]
MCSTQLLPSSSEYNARKHPRPRCQGHTDCASVVRKDSFGLSRRLDVNLGRYEFQLGHCPFNGCDWSPEDLLEKHEIWYPLGKTIAERKAHEFIQTEAPSFSLAALNQTWIFDPMLQPTLNESSQQISHNFTGDLKKIPNDFKYGVDVRDLAAAHVAAFENPDANGAMFSSVGKRRKPRFARI